MIYFETKIISEQNLNEYDDFKIWERNLKKLKDIYYPMINKIKKSTKNSKNF